MRVKRERAYKTRITIRTTCNANTDYVDCVIMQNACTSIISIIEMKPPSGGGCGLATRAALARLLWSLDPPVKCQACSQQYKDVIMTQIPQQLVEQVVQNPVMIAYAMIPASPILIAAAATAATLGIGGYLFYKARTAQEDTRTQIAQEDTLTQIAQKDTLTQIAQEDTRTQTAQKDTRTQTAQKDTRTQTAQQKNHVGGPGRGGSSRRSLCICFGLIIETVKKNQYIIDLSHAMRRRGLVALVTIILGLLVVSAVSYLIWKWWRNATANRRNPDDGDNEWGI